MFHIPLSITVTDQVCFLLLLSLLFVSQVYVFVYYCLWLPPFLVILLCIEQGLNQIPLKEQTLSPSTYPYNIDKYDKVWRTNISYTIYS